MTATTEATAEALERARENRQWVRDFRDGMFDINAPHLPAEFFGLVDSVERLAVDVIRLVGARGDIESEWKHHLDIADQDDDDGAHVGLARFHRTIASGLGDALNIIDGAFEKPPPD